MLEYISQILIIVLLFNKPFESNGLHLPSKELIQEFAMRNDLNYIIIYMHFPVIPQQVLTEYCKNRGKNKISMKCLTMKQLENIDKIVFQNQDLHLFILDANDLQTSFETFKRIFNKRERSRKEYWILDVSYSNESTRPKLIQSLEDLYLDLDDDLYLFENRSILEKSDQHVVFFETYRLQDELPSKFQYYAKWLEGVNKLEILTTNKWFRRKDLTGVRFKCNAIPGPLYVQRMIPNLGATGQYHLEGFFSDVFATLQV